MSRSVSATSLASGNRRGNSRYRTVNRSSTVDESLFSNKKGATTYETPGPRTGPTHPPKGYGMTSKKPETLRLVTKDLIRTLKVPEGGDPSGHSVVLTSAEYDRIKNASTFVSAEDKKAMVEERQARQQELQNASFQRKEVMEQQERTRKKNEKLTDLEEEARERAQHLISQAKQAEQEQEDEIKQLNQLLLEAKCNAIRDLQADEKCAIKQELDEEERRLDAMMEAERRKAIKQFEREEQAQQIERLRGAHMVQQQIAEREQQRLLDEEKRDQEQQQMLRYLERLQKEDMDAMEQKREDQRMLMAEVGKANEEIIRQKQLKKDQEKQEEARLAQYLKEKAEREEEIEKQLEWKRRQKEAEATNMKDAQQRARLEQEAKDALRAKRNQEQAEREWRRKEKEIARKKQEMDAMLKQARHDQVAHKEHFLAVQAARDRMDFEKTVHEQEKAMAEDKRTEEKRAKTRRQYADAVKQQITQCEESRIEARKNFFQEGQQLDEEARQRRERLHAIKMRKLEDLRAAGIPEKYCSQVSRHIHAPPPSFTMSKLT